MSSYPRSDASLRTSVANLFATGSNISTVTGNLGCGIDPMVPLAKLVIPGTDDAAFLGEDGDPIPDHSEIYVTSRGPRQQRCNNPPICSCAGPAGVICDVTSFDYEVKCQVKNLGLLDSPAL